mgnify:CR=1 FL=1
MEYAFNMFNKLAKTGLIVALQKFLENENKPPIVLCIGSDLAIGDSLGPMTGTLLKQKTSGEFFIYGTLKKPITAKEVQYLNRFFRETHPDSKIIAVDAAVGESGDIGLLKIYNKSLRPGLGANKKLCAVGDISIMGIVAEKSVFNYSLLNLTRLNLVYKMSEIISDSLADFFQSFNSTKFINQAV